MGSKTPWQAPDFFVSHYAYDKKVRDGFKGRLPRKVKFHDITLRDGEQQPNIIFRKDEKVQIARALDEAGIDRIEVGLPSVSRMEFEAVKEIAHLGLSSKVYAFARCLKSDVDLALKCDVDGVMMEVPSSDHLIKYGYGWTEDRAVSAAVEATQYAHEHGLPVTFFTIDSTRAPFQVFWRLVNAVATEGHMDALTIVDTFGVASPEAIAFLVRKVRKKLGKRAKPLEIHVHNDFGLAVANTIAAVREGVETVHTTVNGIGERSGNAATEEVALALNLLYGVKTNVRFEKLKSLGRLVSNLSLVETPPQKPVTGENLFRTESGIIAGWWVRLEKLGMPLEMFPFLPTFTGHEDKVRVVLGKKSGRDSVVYRAEGLGLATNLTEDQITKILTEVKETSESLKRILTDEEFVSIVNRVVK